MFKILFKQIRSVLAGESHEPNITAAALERLFVILMFVAIFLKMGFGMGFYSIRFALFPILSAFCLGIWHFFFCSKQRFCSSAYFIIPVLILSYAIDCCFLEGTAQWANFLFLLFATWTALFMFKMRGELSTIPFVLVISVVFGVCGGFSDYAAIYEMGKSVGADITTYGLSPKIGSGRFGSVEGLEICICMALPYALGVVCSRKYRTPIVVGAVAVIMFLSYAAFLSFSLAIIACVICSCLSACLIFSCGGSMRHRRILYFSIMSVGMIAAYILYLVYVCKLASINVYTYFSSLFASYADSISEYSALIGILPNAHITALKYAPTYFNFVAQYGLLVAFLISACLIFVVIRGALILTDIPVEKWDNNKFRLPFEQRKQFSHHKLHEREIMRYESSKTPFSRVIAGSSFLSILNYTVLIFFTGGGDDYSAILFLCLSVAILSRFVFRNVNFGFVERHKILCAFAPFAFCAVFAFAQNQQYSEKLKKTYPTDVSLFLSEKTCKSGESGK